MKLNRKLFSALMVVVMMMSMLLPVSAATLDATYQKANYYEIATTAYSRMLMFQDGVVPAANKDKQYGLIDATGREVVPFQYAGAWILGNGLFMVENAEGLKGIIDAKGKEIYPMTAGYINLRGNYISLYDTVDGDYHYFNLSMKEVDEEEVWNSSSSSGGPSGYDYGWMSNGYYQAYKGSQMALLDKNYNVIFALGEYDSVGTLTGPSGTVFVVHKNNEAALLDANKKVIVPFGTYSNFMEDWNGGSLIKVYQGQYPDQKMGAIDFAGNVLVPLGEYQEIGGINQQGYVSAVTNPYDAENVTSTVFQNGKKVKTFDGMRVATEAYYRDLAFSKDGEHNGMMDIKGKVIIPDKYTYITYGGYGNDLVTVSPLSPDSWESVYGLYHADGTQVLQDKYTVLSHLANGKYKAYDGAKYGVLSSADGKAVIPMKYQDLRVQTLNFIYGYDGTSYVVLDLNNNVVVPASSAPIDLFHDSLTTGTMYDGISNLSHAMYLSKSWDGYDGSVMPFRIKTANGYATVYADYKTGTNHAEVPYIASNINSDGQFVYVDKNGLYGFAQTTNAPWAGVVSKVEPPVEEKPAETKDQPSSWAVELVNEAVTAGIVPEALQAKFTQNTTRAEFCALAVQLYETVTGTEVEGRTTFNDTTDVNVEKAAYLGVVSGLGDGKFGPTNELTREQAAVMLSQLADALGMPLAEAESDFADNDTVSGWAKNFVGKVKAADIMNGVGDNQFAPQAKYTREQSIITALKLFRIADEK